MAFPTFVEAEGPCRMSFADLNIGRRNNWEQWNCGTVGIAHLFGDCGNIFFPALATIGIDVGYRGWDLLQGLLMEI